MGLARLRFSVTLKDPLDIGARGEAGIKLNGDQRRTLLGVIGDLASAGPLLQQMETGCEQLSLVPIEVGFVRLLQLSLLQSKLLFYPLAVAGDALAQSTFQGI
jgi:hypothetical protein